MTSGHPGCASMALRSPTILTWDGLPTNEKRQPAAAGCMSSLARGATGLRGPAKPRTLIIRGDIRGVWQQHGPGADGRTLPALTATRHRLARRLATELRRRGHRLGRRAGDGRGGPGAARLRRTLRDLRP